MTSFIFLNKLFIIGYSNAKYIDLFPLKKVTKSLINLTFVSKRR